VLPEERRYVDAITRLTGKPIPRLELGGMEADGDAAAPAAERPRRGRGAARSRAPEAAPVESSPTLPEPAAEPAGEELAEPRERSRSRRRRRPAGDVRPAADVRSAADGRPEPAAAAEPSVEPQPRPAAEPRARSRRGAGSGTRQPAPAAEPRRSSGDNKPVVGMGDHVPLFMQRPVPQIESLPDAAED